MKIKLAPPFLTVEMVAELKNDKALITASPIEQMAKFGDEERQVYRIAIELADGNKKAIWTPNDRSLNNLAAKWGIEGDDWVGKTIKLEVGKSSRGQKMIIVNPV